MMNISLTWKDEYGKDLNSKVIKAYVSHEKIKITIEVDFKNYEYIIANELFNLYKEALGKNFRTSFNKAKPIEIQLQLNSNLISVLQLGVELNKEKVLNYLIKKSNEDRDNIFISTESWYGLNVKQEEDLPEELKKLGSVKSGFDTRWSQEL